LAYPGRTLPSVVEGPRWLPYGFHPAEETA
jgi:hypothetical protein